MGLFMRSKILTDDYIKITDKVKVAIPLFKDVYEYEKEYFLIAHHLTDMPFTRMAELWLAKIDYVTITFYDLFIQALYELQILCTGTPEQVSQMFGVSFSPSPDLVSLFFVDLDVGNLVILKHKNGSFIVIDKLTHEVVFDEDIIDKTADALRKIIGTQKDKRKEDIGGASGRYVLERSVKVLKREIKKLQDHPRQYSYLESCLVTLVNTEKFPYNFETVMNVKYILFVLSLRQFVHTNSVDNINLGIYTGNIPMDKISNKDQNYFLLENEN